MLLRTFCSPLAGLVLAGGLLLPAVAEARAPAATSIAGKVMLYRDAMGVPHVFGDTSAAVMFGAGYALAQDRLAAMELQRRAAAGRRAELLGKSAIETDKTARDRRLPDVEHSVVLL